MLVACVLRPEACDQLLCKNDEEINKGNIRYLQACLVGFAVVTDVIEAPEARAAACMSISFGVAVVWTRGFDSYADCSRLRGSR